MKNILEFNKAKETQQKITMVTCYDYWSAKIINASDIDCILVGDSLAMVMHGYENTIAADIDLMALHTAAVARGAVDKFIISDMPFLSYRKSSNRNMEAVEKIMRAGANAIKLEGATGNLELIRHVVDSGIPVMGHIGLTPQSIHHLGGFRIQGKDPKKINQLKRDADALAQAGCFAIVLECVPDAVAKEITQALKTPIIGIGAGPNTDGQVLVLHDLLGMNQDFKPKFLKVYFDGFNTIKNSLNEYNKDVKNLVFPNIEEHCY
ncbi:MAG: 3-methyl-2-oxobutanoate hydroxymethyltransferase [Gammaproteobacteria bacterium]|nr:3-methyl-2-oxobutanoate hydroxymethyltransferase [Gammaproteobacteria bacterium]